MKAEAPTKVICIISLHIDARRRLPQALNDLEQVTALLPGHFGTANSKSMHVIATFLMGDQYDPLDRVGVNQEAEMFIDDLVLIPIGSAVSQTGGSAGDRQTVKMIDAEAPAGEVVDMLAQPAIAAIENGGGWWILEIRN
jgi:hypothetical protein